jgi:putative transposase
MVATLWDGIAARFSGVEIDQFVVMPNHLHGILVLMDGDERETTAKRATTERATTRVGPTNDDPVGAPLVGARVRLGNVIGAFKSLATIGYIGGVKANGWPEFRGRLWQRSYYEHIVRDEDALNRIRRYIDDNPARWEFDDENPQKAKS